VAKDGKLLDAPGAFTSTDRNDARLDSTSRAGAVSLDQSITDAVPEAGDLELRSSDRGDDDTHDGLNDKSGQANDSATFRSRPTSHRPLGRQLGPWDKLVPFPERLDQSA